MVVFHVSTFILQLHLAGGFDFSGHFHNPKNEIVRYLSVTPVFSWGSVVSRVMRKIDSVIWQKSITGGGLTAPWLLHKRAGRKGSRAAESHYTGW